MESDLYADTESMLTQELEGRVEADAGSYKAQIDKWNKQRQVSGRRGRGGE